MKELTLQEIGRRISKLRKEKDLSQGELSKLITISRSSLTQIELGKRNISVLELRKISEVLSVSYDKLLADEFHPKRYVIENPAHFIIEEERISYPSMNPVKIKEVLLYLLEKCAGKPNVGETVLYKLLYFSDFNYYEIYEAHLSGATYRKMNYGPVPQNIETVVNEMIDAKKIERFKTTFHGYPQTRFIPLVKPNLQLLKASETDVLDKVIEQFSDWSATAISEYSHKDIPWMASQNGEVIDYELAFYREAPFSARNYEA
jgi:transcriptional regulator with XRE-family HTH domain